MNRATRSAMMSPLFASGTSDKAENTESIMIKGATEQSGDGTMIINGPNGSFKINQHNLRERLHTLKSQVAVPIKSLDPTHGANFSSIVEVMRLLHASPALYNIILADIQSIFSNIGPVVPGTVGSFFMGCFNNDSFSGPMGCNPKCAASLSPPEGTPGFSTCSELVLIYSNGYFSALNTERTPRAFIYIGNADFTGFTKDNITQLADAGVEQATLIYGNADGSYREITDPIPIASLPQSTASTLTTTSTDSSSSTAAAVVFGIILGLLVLALLYFVFVGKVSWN